MSSPKPLLVVHERPDANGITVVNVGYDKTDDTSTFTYFLECLTLSDN